MLPTRDSGPAVVTLKWLSQYCDTNEVASYYYTTSLSNSIFSVPVYHWVAPFDNPRTLNHAAFYYEGKFLGYRVDGFQNMLHRIQLTHPRQIFLLGSLYNLNSDFGPNEAPYENEEDMLGRVIKDNRTQLIHLEPLLGF
jgi:hypothetical protein